MEELTAQDRALQSRIDALEHQVKMLRSLPQNKVADLEDQVKMLTSASEESAAREARLVSIVKSLEVWPA